MVSVCLCLFGSNRLYFIVQTLTSRDVAKDIRARPQGEAFRGANRKLKSRHLLLLRLMH